MTKQVRSKPRRKPGYRCPVEALAWIALFAVLAILSGHSELIPSLFGYLKGLVVIP